MDRDPRRGFFWDVFRTWSCPDYLEIQRVDSPDAEGEPFESDDEAVAFVMYRACREGDHEARDAVREIVTSWE